MVTPLETHTTSNQLDAETEGSTRFRNPRARGCRAQGCSARAQRGHYLRARRFLNRVDPRSVEASNLFSVCYKYKYDYNANQDEDGTP